MEKAKYAFPMADWIHPIPVFVKNTLREQAPDGIFTNPGAVLKS